jgi:hypothetical protein
LREFRAVPALALPVLAAMVALSGFVRDRPAAATRASTPACLAGRYDGGQMELAAALELESGGRFRFALSYGALDELAQGTWRFAEGQVRLTPTSQVPGTANLADTPLAYQAGVLVLPRHGRLLRFRRVGPDCKGGSRR